MHISPLKLAAAAAIAGAIALGGVSLASAQEDGGTTDREECPHGAEGADTTSA